MNSLESSTMESSSLTESNTTEITRPSTSKSGLELKSQSPQECIQKKNDNKLKNNEESCSSISSSAKSFFPELAITSPNTSKCIYKLCAKYQCLLNLKKIYRETQLISDSPMVRDMYLKFIHDIEISEMQTLSKIIEIHENLEKNIEREVRKVNSDRTAESSENDEGSKNYQNQEKENCQKPQEIDKIPSFKSADAPVENSEVKNSTNSTTNVFDNPNILSTSTSHSDGQSIKTIDDEELIKFAESYIIEIAGPNRYSKYIVELKFQSWQECIHKIDKIPSFKSADAPVENSEVKNSTNSTTNVFDNPNILSTSTSHSDGQSIETIDDEELIKYAESDIIEIAGPNRYSKYIVELKFQSWQECIHKIDKIPSFKSADAPVENSEVKNSTNSTTNVFDNPNILSTSISDNRQKTESDEKFMDAMDSPELPTLIIEDRQREEILHQSLETTTEIPPKHKITDKAQKYEEPEEYPDKIKKEIKCSSKCLILLSFIIPKILFLFLFMLLLYYFKSLDTNKNDEFVDSFATAVVEVEEGILDHDATVRVLSEYLERDTPLLKVVALVGDTSVDKPYTVDIIKKRLRKRRNNSSSPSLPSFVVLENLRAEHSTVVIDYAETYQEAYGNQEFTIVAVFKVEQIDDDLTRADINHVINKVKDSFIKANIIMKIIPFKPLSEEALEKYIINTAKNIGQTLSQDQIDYHKRRLMEDFTDCHKKYGCYKDHI